MPRVTKEIAETIVALDFTVNSRPYIKSRLLSTADHCRVTCQVIKLKTTL